MKKSVVPIIILFIIICLFGFACKRKDIEMQIESKLPILYTGCNLKNDDNIIIRDQDALDSIFTKEIVNQIIELQNIDFSKFNVLVGAATYTRGINRLEYKFFKSNDGTYVYEVSVFLDITHPAGLFYYGIIVDKLPSDAIVTFKIDYYDA